ncbi:cytochrome ubiquinol oxidase subunit I [Gandjariella thermophila]|uniref:Cytochrome ubiquinol oxidase subunit I n=1 Tax=Gandjariella thermophila TaxID=1931992 RepID=A0A4D4JA19_9PSEU|nr:cytochrome ubiquinol oxidase subunit I [Gandjariella thermophila]GDY31518.1 cytochrome ubiquinol oxidase subunit I [Gandjariella thermophila]
MTDLMVLSVPAQVLPARAQMAFTLAYHIILVPIGVSLPFITLLMNFLGLRRNDPVALQLARRWSAVMAVTFAVGAVTGTVLSFEFGLLWPAMLGRFGDVFGLGFTIEGWAFFLEAILIGIYLYGWRRMRPWPHFLAGLPLPLVAVVGAFGVLAANAWMNTPTGFVEGPPGTPSRVNIRRALFTPIFGPELWHFLGAAYMTAAFLVAGVYAVGWLRGRRDRYHRLGFAVPFGVGAIAAPVQVVLGDVVARAVFNLQPTKFAAMELVWNTDTHVTEYVFGRLNPDGTVSGGIPIPWFDSILAGFSPSTRVRGLTAVPPNTRPAIPLANITHTAFDVMVVVGSLLLLLAIWCGVVLLRHRRLPESRWFYRAAALAGVAAVVCMEAGWVTTEVGRQPWIVYQYMYVADAVTNIGPAALWISFGTILVIYGLIGWGLVAVLRHMRLRWRAQDHRAARVGPPDAGVPYGPPEAEVPYGPRPGAPHPTGPRGEDAR